jgi:FAD/FMN-containing dehydrogenase/Fe-S oxidoreductase
MPNQPHPDGSVSKALRSALGDQVDVSTRRRAEYSSDASNYRVVPQAVVFPRSGEDVRAVVEICRELGTPLTARGGGTSTAGNSIGAGVVLDLNRYMNRVLTVDPAARTAVVQPGVVLDDLQRATRPHGLRFGPDPSTHARCTIGGMIGNNSCGARSIAYGTTSTNVLALELLDGTGRHLSCGVDLSIVAGLEAFVSDQLTPVASEFGRFGRQVSGYSLEHLLPTRGANLARAIVGTEGTCGVVLEAKVSLVESPAASALAVLGYPDMPSAADAVPDLKAFGLHALEGIDARMLKVLRAHRSGSTVPDLPKGDAWLFAEVAGETPADAVAVAQRLARSAGALDTMVVANGPVAARLWRIREDGAGLAGRTPSGAPAWPAWEDAAVPPAHLGAYLREFEALLAEHHLDGLLYGHFGDGCVHVRIDLPLSDHPERLRPFLVDSAQLVVRHGGSLSGEHGDGRARSELLPLMYSPEALAAMDAFKHLFDPKGFLNPGIVVAPFPVDANLRLPFAQPLRIRSRSDATTNLVRETSGFALHGDHGDLSEAVHRCVGIGKCRADTGNFMCPSYLATHDEKDSTRGRARVLQEMANGTLVRGWNAPEVHESLDLCLSCKACSRDCPASVDMATYKSEVLNQRYRKRLRPASHYSLGWLPRWLSIASRAPAIANRVLHMPGLSAITKRLAGVDARRAIPALSYHPLTNASLRCEVAACATHHNGAERVVLWADTFSRAFSPEVARAAIAVLTEAGFQVVIPEETTCCGLTWISTGQLDGARRQLGATIRSLASYAREGLTIVGLEPSCVAVLRSDLIELFPNSPDAAGIARATRTLAETLLGPAGARRDLSWLAQRLDGTSVIAQPHCHHYAVMGYDADLAVLDAAGCHTETIAGCCGLAGNFGMERGHYDISVAVAEHALLPALRGAPVTTILLADGFSCRTQAEQLANRRAWHLAELLHLDWRDSASN